MNRLPHIAIFFATVLLVAALAGCGSVEQKNEATKKTVEGKSGVKSKILAEQKTEKATNIEGPVPPLNLIKKEKFKSIFFSNDFHDVYSCRDNDIDYTILKLPGDSENTIRAIICKDKRFITPEGVRVGQSLKDVKRLTGGDYMTMHGFGYWVTLPSGWNAVFFQGSSATDGPLALDSKVALITKCNYLWDSN